MEWNGIMSGFEVIRGDIEWERWRESEWLALMVFDVIKEAKILPNSAWSSTKNSPSIGSPSNSIAFQKSAHQSTENLLGLLNSFVQHYFAFVSTPFASLEAEKNAFWLLNEPHCCCVCCWWLLDGESKSLKQTFNSVFGDLRRRTQQDTKMPEPQ